MNVVGSVFREWEAINEVKIPTLSHTTRQGWGTLTYLTVLFVKT